MVDQQKQAREALLNLITYVCGLPFFERKFEVVNALYDVEFKLRPSAVKVDNKVQEVPEEFDNGHEEGWNT